MKWPPNAEVAARANAMGADTPTRASCYYDPLILEKRASVTGAPRHFEVTRRAIETGMGTAPHMPAWPDLARPGHPRECTRTRQADQRPAFGRADAASDPRQDVEVSGRAQVLDGDTTFLADACDTV
jgi:hypothetical protein